MRVTCHSVDEFLEDLRVQVDAYGRPIKHKVKHAGRAVIVQKTVRVSVFRKPLDDEPAHRALRFAVVLQASAVVSLPEDGEYLLQAGIDCGIDREDAPPEMEGSEKAVELKKKIQAFCDEKGLTVGPGMIEP